MYKTIILCLLLHISLSAADPICPCGEIYDPCGTACALTCDQPEFEPCRKLCTPGCFCPPGKIRNSNNKCVLPCHCKTCPKGETWIECGTGCPPTCAIPKPEICTLQCVTGCFCNEGTVRDQLTKKCIPLKDCRCPEREYWAKCGSTCTTTCTNQTPKCTLPCVEGCTCISGYVRDKNNNNKCIPLENCPEK